MEKARVDVERVWLAHEAYRMGDEHAAEDLVDELGWIARDEASRFRVDFDDMVGEGICVILEICQVRLPVNFISYLRVSVRHALAKYKIEKASLVRVPKNTLRDCTRGVSSQETQCKVGAARQEPESLNRDIPGFDETQIDFLVDQGDPLEEVALNNVLMDQVLCNLKLLQECEMEAINAFLNGMARGAKQRAALGSALRKLRGALGVD